MSSLRRERRLDATHLRTSLAVLALVFGAVGCSGVSSEPPLSTVRPATGPVELVPTGDLIPPGTTELTVTSLDSVDAADLAPVELAMALSQGIALEHVGGLRSTEPRVLSGLSPGTYRLTNRTSDYWLGHIVCLRNEEQVRCAADADVWRVEMPLGHAVDLRPEFPVGPADRLQILLTAEGGSDQPTRIGGAYAGETPDTFEDYTLVTPVAAVSDPLRCATAALEGASVRLRLCDQTLGTFRIVAVTDGTTLSPGSARRQIPLLRPQGTGEFVVNVAPQLSGVEDASKKLVLLWTGLDRQLPEAWYVMEGAI